MARWLAATDECGFLAGYYQPSLTDEEQGVAGLEGLDTGDLLRETVVNEGRYRHYKGKEYLVLGVATHSETLEAMVLYRQDYGKRGLWVRPKEMFLESVEIEGQMITRFLYIGPE